VWTQWADLDGPDGVTLLHPGNAPLDSDAIESVTFYVPEYMSGRAGLEPVRRMPNLAHLQLANAGFDDAIEFARSGLTIHNARGVHDMSTAELVGIIGFGSIGQTIARMMEPFDVEVVPFTSSGRNSTNTLDALESLLPTLDVVVLILPATPDTVGLVDAEFLRRMKDDALLVNVARGPIVDTDALVAELRTGRLRAAVDVTDPEPLPPGHPLWSLDNVIISPHVGGNSTAFEPRMRALVRAQLDKLVSGEPLDNVVLRGTELA
jgi:lactate dehydrogenase-like 2-hydroxyacid dehydrogenase